MDYREIKMGKRIILSILFCAVVSLSYSQSYHTYEAVYEKGFGIGDQENKSGVYYPSNEIGINGPSGIGFGVDGSCFVLDHINKRIVSLGKDWEFLKWWEVNSLPVESRIEATNDYVKIFSGRRFDCIDRKDTGRISVEFDLSRSNQRFQYYLLDSVLFIYIDKGLYSIPKPGADEEENNRKILGEEETRKILEEGELYGLAGVKVDEKNRLFVDGELQTRDYKTYIEYWMDHYQIDDFQTYRRSDFHQFKPIHKDSREISYIGQDYAGCTYWNVIGLFYILVFNENGMCIETLKYDPEMSSTLPAVHPSGDIYFLDYDTEGVYLYRIENVWDAEGRGAWYESAGESSSDYVDGVVNDDRVRVRTAPNLESDTLGYVNRGDAVMIQDETKELMKIGDMEAVWYRIGFEGKEGWVYGWFVDKK
jgi:hypothetical protein